MKMKNLITDTMTEHGRWSMKRVASFITFWLAIAYEFILGSVFNLHTNQYVWDGLLLFASALIGGSIVDKKFDNKAKPIPPPTPPHDENIG